METTTLNEAAGKLRSRRALLAGVVGGLGTLLASAAQRVMPVEAAAGDPIRMGQFNTAGATSTTVQNSSGPTLRAVQLGGGTALKAEATSGRAVQALAGRNGTGVWAYSPNHYGVHARTDRGVAIRAFAAPDGHALLVVGRTVMGGDTFAGGRLRTGFGIFFDRNNDLVPPNTNQARLFARDNGLGKTQLCVEFAGGDIQVLATQP